MVSTRAPRARDVPPLTQTPQADDSHCLDILAIRVSDDTLLLFQFIFLPPQYLCFGSLSLPGTRSPKLSLVSSFPPRVSEPGATRMLAACFKAISDVKALTPLYSQGINEDVK